MHNYPKSGNRKNKRGTGGSFLLYLPSPPIIYGYGYLSSKRRRRQTDASPSLPSLAARMTSRLVRHNTFETHLPRPDTTVEVVLRCRQHAITKVKVSTPPRKKSCFRLPARGMAFVNPSPATEELRPRRRSGNDQRGGGRCSSFNWCLFVACSPPPNCQM